MVVPFTRKWTTNKRRVGFQYVMFQLRIWQNVPCRKKRQKNYLANNKKMTLFIQGGKGGRPDGWRMRDYPRHLSDRLPCKPHTAMSWIIAPLRCMLDAGTVEAACITCRKFGKVTCPHRQFATFDKVCNQYHSLPQFQNNTFHGYN